MIGKGLSRRVLFCIPAIAGGGIERVTANLANELQKLGWQVGIISIEKKPGTSLPAVDVGVKVFESLGGPTGLKHHYVPSQTLDLRRIIVDFRPDVVVSTYPRVHFAVGLAMRIISRTRRPLWMAIDHGDPRVYLGKRTAGRILKLAFVRFAIAKCDAHAAISDFVKKSVELSYSTRVDAVLRNPAVALENLPARPPADWATDLPYIVSMGRLEVGKQLHVLLEAFKAVRLRQNVQLVVIGEGSERSNLERQAESLGIHHAVRFMGYVENPFELLRGASALAFSSRSEGQPTALIEAMAFGVPVATTAFPGIEDLLDPATDALTSPVGDAGALGASILRLLEDHELRERLIQRGRVVAEAYDVRTTSRAYASFFDGLLEERGRRSAQRLEIDPA